MKLGKTFARYWPWWLALGFLGVYELIALAGQPKTLSAMVWQAHGNFPHLAIIVTVVTLVLLWHFFIQKPPADPR